MSHLIEFFNGAVGRLLRVVLGVFLVWYGLVVLGGTAGPILAVVGLIPVGLGLWGRCLLEVVPATAARSA